MEELRRRYSRAPKQNKDAVFFDALVALEPIADRRSLGLCRRRPPAATAAGRPYCDGPAHQLRRRHSEEWPPRPTGCAGISRHLTR